MKPKDIIIATAVILIISSLLNGCTSSNKVDDINQKSPAMSKTQMADIQAIFQKAQMVKKDVNMVLSSEKINDKITVDINLKNFNKKQIISVQSWLSFDAKKLKGIDIDVSKSAFKLAAPYKNGFDNINGLLMLGRSGPKPITDEEIYVATVTFEVLERGNITIDTYDYRENLAGHTSANIIVDDQPYNVLSRPENPILIINSY